MTVVWKVDKYADDTVLSHVRCLTPIRRSDQQPAGHSDDPGGGHQRPGQRTEPTEGQGGEDGGGAGGAAESDPFSGRAAETADPVPGEGTVGISILSI